MPKPLNIHPDFQNLRSVALSFNPFFLTFINVLLRLAVAIKSLRYSNMITRTKVIGLDGHRLPIWIIRPENLKSSCPALLYFHGGAFILKHTPQHIKNAVSYTREANCCVVFVDFRLAPQHPFPAAFDDCYAALLWTLQNAEKLGIDKQRVAVGGDSAGGTLAATVAQKAVHDDAIRLCGQLLLYPVADADCKSPSSALYTDVPPLKRFSVRAMWEAYLGHALEKGVPVYASPLHGNLTNVAPAYVETTEFDALHDESAAYAQALVANGVEVRLNETQRTVHGYDLIAPASDLSRRALETRAQYLRKIFRT